MSKAKFLAIDVSTKSLTIAVKSADGKEDIASVVMQGAKPWHDQPAFDLDYLQGMILEVLKQLTEKGWQFDEQGALSIDVRQHDMAVLNKFGGLLMPALSWECNAAVEETAWINENRHSTVVGNVEERFILPKLMWALNQEPSLRDSISRVMTTGDYIAFRLTGIQRLSASDAFSNALLSKLTKHLAAESIRQCGLDPNWFPPVVNSGDFVGNVRQWSVVDVYMPDKMWREVCQLFCGWKVFSSLGDNHSGAVGCGLNSDDTIVASFGSSGTVVRLMHPRQERQGNASLFEYYNDELLLMMMARCAVWYDEFIEKACALSPNLTKRKIDEAIMNHIKSGAVLPLVRIEQKKMSRGMVEIYPRGWDDDYPLSFQAASVQASIGLEMLLLVKKMLAEVPTKVEKVVLTGGLTRSAFLREVFLVGLEILQPGLKLFVSAHEGPLAFKASAYGALINAMIGDSYRNCLEVIRENCPTSEVSSCRLGRKAISTFLKKYL